MQRVISRITSTSDSVYFNDAGALERVACETTRDTYTRRIKNIRSRTRALLSSSNDDSGRRRAARDHVSQRFEIMRQLLTRSVHRSLMTRRCH